jgi:hypothetical protein
MPRKFTLEQRKRMLERLEHGATHSDLKAEFGIRDGRTLDKQLKQGREEQALRVARTEIIKESLSDHLAEVRSLIETWRSRLKAPSPPSLGRYPLSAAAECEQQRLFEGIRQHLPFSELWKTYSSFKTKWDDYLGLCEQLHKEVVEQATREWSLQLLNRDDRRPGLTSSFSWETVDQAMKIAAGTTKGGKPAYSAAPLPPGADIQFLECDGRVILCVDGDATSYADKHWAMVREWAQSEKVRNIVAVLSELRSLESKLQGVLEEVLLRRDYIFSSCGLCPGESKLTFK